MLETGTVAPDFSLPDQDGNIVTLSTFRGKKVLLYFYPKDNTAGCTKQACGYAKEYPHFCDANTVVIGVSKDSVVSHKKFETKNDLPFLLISDEELTAIKAYDVWHEKTMCGNKYMGVVRTTYLIDEEGIIIRASDKVKAATDAEKMLEEATMQQ